MEPTATFILSEVSQIFAITWFARKSRAMLPCLQRLKVGMTVARRIAETLLNFRNADRLSLSLSHVLVASRLL